jgi:hypothetical protein
MWPSGNIHMCTTDNAVNVKEANALGPGAIVLQAACEGPTTLERDNLNPHAALTIATCVTAVNFLSGRPRPHFPIVHCQSWPDKVVEAVRIGSFSTTAVLSHWTRTAESNRIVRFLSGPTLPSRLIRNGSGLVHETGEWLLEVLHNDEK